MARQRVRHNLHEHGLVSEIDPNPSFEVVAMPEAKPDDRGHIDLERRGHLWRRLETERHVERSPVEIGDTGTSSNAATCFADPATSAPGVSSLSGIAVSVGEATRPAL